MTTALRLISLSLLVVFGSAALAQDPGPQAPIDPVVNAASTPAPANETAPPQVDSSSAPAPKLRMGPGDQFDISVYGVPDLSQQNLRLNDAGVISLPLIGDVTLAGLTAQEAQTLIEQKYSEGKFLKDPHVSINVKEYSSQGITVIGEVQHPGTYSALKARRLFELFMQAGGLTQRAGTSVVITHANAKSNPEKIEISGDPLHSPEANVAVSPGDTVVVSRAGIVYVMGEVTRPGGFVITTPDGKITLMQALAMASGPTRMANLGHTRLLRRTPSGLDSMDIDLGKILQARSADLPLSPDDVIYVPASRGKLFANQSAGSVLSTLASLAIYRF